MEAQLLDGVAEYVDVNDVETSTMTIRTRLFDLIFNLESYLVT